MHCYCVYTPLWLWYWPWVHNVLQRITWGKKPHLHSKAVGRQRRRLSDQKPRRVQTRRRERELGATPSEIGQKTLWKAWRAKLQSYGTCHGGHVWDVGLHAQKRCWARDVTWITGHRRWSRYGESPWRRNVRAGGCEGDGAGLTQERPAGCGCTRGVLCNKEQTTSQFKIVVLSHSRLTNPWQLLCFSVCHRALCRLSSFCHVHMYTIVNMPLSKIITNSVCHNLNAGNTHNDISVNIQNHTQSLQSLWGCFSDIKLWIKIAS